MILWIKEYFRKYWIDSEKIDAPYNRISGLLAFAGIGGLCYGLFFYLFEIGVMVPQYSDLIVDHGTLQIIKKRKGTSYIVEIGNGEREAMCSQTQCGLLASELSGADVTVWIDGNRIWQIAKDQRLIMSYEGTIERRKSKQRYIAVWSGSSLIFLICAMIRQRKRFREN